MKRFISLFVGCSLAIAGVAIAQQPDQQESPGNKKGKGNEQQTAAEVQSGKGQGQGKKNRAMNEGGNQTTTTGTQGGKGHKNRANQESVNAPSSDVSPGVNGSQMGGGKHGKKAERAAKMSATPGASVAPSSTVAAEQNTAVGKAGKAGRGGKKVDQQQLQQIKSQNANFKAQPKPEKVPAVTFNPNYRIQGVERWSGPQYEVFRAYHPERHDEMWYRSHFSRVELIGGGYYYFNNGYWFPAWGYNPGAEYYAWDGPIYVGRAALPPDQVIANVQAELQQMGYYRGEVDGLLGPLTREALAAYQTDQGLMQTAAIDEPTLDSLGLS